MKKGIVGMDPRMTDRIQCKTEGCINTILLSTADETGGFCMPCVQAVARREREDYIQKHRSDVNEFDGVTDPVEALKVGLGKVISVIHNDGSVGLAEFAPYDRIFVTAASPGIPPPLIDQLADGGKLLIPSGSSYISELTLVTKTGKKIKKRKLGGCAFVPLRGKYGFQ